MTDKPIRITFTGPAFISVESDEIEIFRHNLPEELKTLPKREPYMESPEAYAGTWARVPGPEEWAKLVEEWNTPDWQWDMH